MEYLKAFGSKFSSPRERSHYSNYCSGNSPGRARCLCHILTYFFWTSVRDKHGIWCHRCYHPDIVLFYYWWWPCWNLKKDIILWDYFFGSANISRKGTSASSCSNLPELSKSSSSSRLVSSQIDISTHRKSKICKNNLNTTNHYDIFTIISLGSTIIKHVIYIIQNHPSSTHISWCFSGFHFQHQVLKRSPRDTSGTEVSLLWGTTKLKTNSRMMTIKATLTPTSSTCCLPLGPLD